jgi:diguanylate cyclase (GGDEF)-like protein/PAS domain S-box-containing protein
MMCRMPGKLSVKKNKQDLGNDELARLRKRVEELEAREVYRKFLWGKYKKSVRRLKESERLAQIGSWEMDIGSGKSNWSEGFFRICGIVPFSMVPTAEIQMQMIHPDDRERVVEKVQEAIKKGTEYSIENRIVRPTGEIRIVISRGEIVMDTDTKSRKLVGAFMDITGQKETEEKIRRMNEELERRVKERTHALKKANKELHRLSVTDELTGVYNRRYFNENLEKEWRRAIRSKESISLIMMDIDFFKLYNDHYGHLKGDECLCCVARALKGAVKRPGDMMARFGGEEFVALLPRTELLGTMNVAKAMMQSVEKLSIPHAKSGITDHVTLSYGISTIQPRKEMKSTVLLREADSALYKAKEGGRNQICTMYE